MKPHYLALALALASGSLLMNVADAQPSGFNYDESKIPPYTLPDPLVLNNGQKVTDAAVWRAQRRPEVLALFQTHVYGRSPGKPEQLQFKVLNEDRQALGGQATRKEVRVMFTGRTNGPSMDLLIYLPNRALKPVPAFLGLNFHGNHTIQADPGITLSTRWMRESKANHQENNRATEASRGTSASNWAVQKILDRGYALATVYYGDLEPDHAEGWRDGVRAVFRPASHAQPSAGPAAPKPAAGAKGAPEDAVADDWGAIGAWAWGLSRALDYLETDPAINARQVAVMGHSRLGKTALWAGATDERFAIVISNDSGCGGAALSKRVFGETVAVINTSFPHWFCGQFKKYNDKESDLPLDQHMLIALVAPRPVYVASAEKDAWADPRGEFLSALHADPVYQLLGKEGLGTETMPELNHPVGRTIGYHIRTGVHDVTEYDWEQYLAFADGHLKKAK